MADEDGTAVAVAVAAAKTISQRDAQSTELGVCVPAQVGLVPPVLAPAGHKRAGFPYNKTG